MPPSTLGCENCGRVNRPQASFCASCGKQLKSPKQWLDEGIALDELGRHQEALTAYDQAILLNPDYVAAYYNKGLALADLKRYQEALTAFELAKRLDTNLGDP